jgi:hypothetical protein
MFGTIRVPRVLADMGKIIVSLPAERFLKEESTFIDFLRFVTTNVKLFDGIVISASKSIAAIAGSSPELAAKLGVRTGASEHWERIAGGKALTPAAELGRYLPLFLELLFCRSVDNFLNYVSDLLTLIYRTKPGALKTNEKVSVADVLEFQDHQELIEALTERRVIGLSLQGMKALHSDLAKTLSFRLFELDSDLDRAAILVERRNLVTHNRGYVNRHFLERVRSAAEKLGDRLTFDIDVVNDDIRFFAVSVLAIDKRAEDKFGLQRAQELDVNIN